MTLLAVHHGDWSSDGSRARLWTGRCLAYERTLSGLILRLFMSLNVTDVAVENSRWIRTRKTEIPPFHLRPDTYWLYRVSEDEMVRLAFDRKGKVVFQYRLLRILRVDDRGNAHKTPRFRNVQT